MKNENCSVDNIFYLDGRVPLGKAIPFGLQHVLAMFVSNLAPISLIVAACVVTSIGYSWMYDYDVRYHFDIWCADACKGWI